MPDKQYWVDFETMVNFMIDVFKGGVPEEDAKICADVLIASDKEALIPTESEG